MNVYYTAEIIIKEAQAVCKFSNKRKGYQIKMEIKSMTDGNYYLLKTIRKVIFFRLSGTQRQQFHVFIITSVMIILQ